MNAQIFLYIEEREQFRCYRQDVADTMVMNVVLTTVQTLTTKSLTTFKTILVE